MNISKWQVILYNYYQNQTANMEVHHPPQLEHKSKPWKQYLLERLMIFIAVMLGFIAENIRENLTDKENEKQSPPVKEPVLVYQ